jgi:GABA permease
MSTKRILVVANETVTSGVLYETIRAHARNGATRVLVVAPALNGRLQYWSSDQGEARRAAGERLVACLDRFRSDGIEANGIVGDPSPMLAIADALAVFPADELVIATHPEGSSNWLARDLIRKARRRFRLPVLHIVVDSTRSLEYVAA